MFLLARPEQIRTPITELFKIQHPILLAGMNVAAGPKLAAAVTNAGGLGVIGGVGYTPDMLREQIAELKESLTDKKAPFGVDLLLPQVGGNARKTKYVNVCSPPLVAAFTCFPFCDPPKRRTPRVEKSTPTCFGHDHDIC